jgi:hypothetical protein
MVSIPGDGDVIGWAAADCDRANARYPGATYQLADASDISALVAAAREFLSVRPAARGHLLARVSAWAVTGAAPAGGGGTELRLLVTVEHRGMHLAQRTDPRRADA